MKMLAVYTTVANMEDARRLARTCIESRLAACVQLSQIESFYSWKGVVEQAHEVRIVFKTTQEKYKELEEALLAGHPYELPAIHAIEVAQSSQAYDKWVHDQVAT